MANNLLKWIYKWSSKLGVIGAISITAIVLLWFLSNYGYGQEIFNGNWIATVFDWLVNVLGAGTGLLILIGFCIGVFNFIKKG